MKNVIIICFLVFGILNSNLIYSEYSSDARNPLEVFSFSDDFIRGKVAAVTNSKGMTYILAEKIRKSDGEVGMDFATLDVNGAVLFSNDVNDVFPDDYIANDFDLRINNDIVLIILGGRILTTYLDLQKGHLVELEFDTEELLNSPIVAGSCVDINEFNEIVYAVPLTDKIRINKIMPDGVRLLESDIIIDGYNTMPAICFVEGGSFYVAYRIYDKLYVDYFDKDGKIVWEGIYVGQETGNNLSMTDKHQIVPDGMGGIYVIWKNKSIFVQRIVSEEVEIVTDKVDTILTGVRKFTDNGLSLTENAVECFSPVVSVDKVTNSLNISWRTQTQNTNTINLQKINIDGNKVFGSPNGLIVSESYLAYKNTPVGISSTVENRINLVFSQYNNASNNYDLVFNRYLNDGTKTFSNSIVVNISDYERSSVVAGDFYHNQMVIAWADSTENGIRTLAQNISYNGTLGEGASNESISAEKLFDYSIYPVPTNESINIRISSDYNIGASVSIFDYSGRLLFINDALELKIGENLFKVDKILPKGEYNVIINTSKGQINQAIIVN